MTQSEKKHLANIKRKLEEELKLLKRNKGKQTTRKIFQGLNYSTSIKKSNSHRFKSMKKNEGSSGSAKVREKECMSSSSIPNPFLLVFIIIVPKSASKCRKSALPEVKMPEVAT